MKLVDASIRYPVSVAVAVILITIFGVLALQDIPVQMIPTLDRPEVTVQTRYPGAGPFEVEEEITKRQEEMLNTVENLREMVSVSKEGDSTVTLRFDYGINKDVARLDVSEKLGAVRDLAEDADESIIRAVNSNEQTPIGWVVLRAEEDINTIRPLADDVIRAQIERVPGVGQVLFYGGEEREVHIELNFSALAARGISIDEVRVALQKENRNIKAGAFDEGKNRFSVRTEGRYRALEEIEETIVRRETTGPTRVKNIASVKFGYEEPQFVIRQNGVPALIMGVLRKSGSNTLEVMNGVRDVLEEINNQYASRGIQLRIVYDASVYIDESISLVSTSLLIGALLATLVLLFFLRSRSAVMVLGLSIPIVLIATFIFMAISGRTLNIISLAGMTFVTGMVLDNAIVVVENIFRHRELGKGTVRAAYDGTVEVWGAILAATLTTLAVFLPIILVEDEAGQIFRDLAIVISIAVALSLIAAITVVPMLAARLLKTPPRTEDGQLIQLIADRLVELLRGILPHRKVRLLSAAGLIAVSMLIIGAFTPDIDYLPEGNRNMVYVVLKTPPSYNLTQSARIVRILEEKFLALPEVHRMFAIVRHGGPSMGIVVKDEFKGKKSMQAFIGRVNKIARTAPGVRQVFARQAPLIRRGNTGSGNMQVVIKGNDFERIQNIASALEPGLKEVPGVIFVNPSFEIGKPEYVVDLDRVRAAELGLSVSEVGFIVETVVAGTVAGTFDDQGREIDLRLRAPAHTISNPEGLARTSIHTPSGHMVQLGDIAKIHSREGPTEIEHRDMDRAVKLQVGKSDDAALGDVINRMEKIIDPVRTNLPLGYSIELAGQADSLTRTWTAFRGAFVLAIVVVYLLMASLFESFLLPAILLVSVPFAATGGILALRLVQLFDSTIKLDTITMLGFVILIGVVVNNGILLIHQTQNRLSEGAEPIQAILDSVATRVRPIFMTMTTTVFGMLPLVFASGSGSELYRGLAAILVGGLMISTVFTLFLVPTLLSFVIRPTEVSIAHDELTAESH